MEASINLDSLTHIYGPLEISGEEFDAILEQSLAPRSSEMLYEWMGKLGLNRNHYLLDIGCRDAAHACRLAVRYGPTVLGIDPLAYHIQLAKEQIAKQALLELVSVREGQIEAIPTDDHTFDFIWCRDMLNHVPDLDRAFSECRRILKPNGRMLIYQTFATNLLEPQEAVRLYAALAIAAANMSTEYVEARLQKAGFQIVERDCIGSEWREYWEEDGTRMTSTQLLHSALLG